MLMNKKNKFCYSADAAFTLRNDDRVLSAACALRLVQTYITVNTETSAVIVFVFILSCFGKNFRC
jgi:hypothetical protein